MKLIRSHLAILTTLYLLCSCGQTRYKKVYVENIGQFQVKDSLMSSATDDSTNLSYRNDSSKLKDYRIYLFDTSANSEQIMEYSSLPEVTNELIARGQFRRISVLGDTTVPQVRPAINPIFNKLSTERLNETYRFYSPKGVYNDSTYNLNHPFINAGIKRNSPKVFSLIYSYCIPTFSFTKKIYAYSPKQADSMEATWKICNTTQRKWKYWESPCLSFGTAIPISRDIVLTAGHCLWDHDLKDFFFYLGYNDTIPGQTSFAFDTSNIYRGIAILDSSSDFDHNRDWAFIRLNKSLPPGAAFSFQREVHPVRGDSCYLIGYPLGIPQRVSLGALIANGPDPNSFTLYIDGFQGDSGSPVFNLKNDSLVGMFNAGWKDFVEQGRCRYFYFCAAFNDCPGENVESITYLLNNPKIIPLLQ